MCQNWVISLEALPESSEISMPLEEVFKYCGWSWTTLPKYYHEGGGGSFKKAKHTHRKGQRRKCWGRLEMRVREKADWIPPRGRESGKVTTSQGEERGSAVSFVCWPTGEPLVVRSWGDRLWDIARPEPAKVTPSHHTGGRCQTADTQKWVRTNQTSLLNCLPVTNTVDSSESREVSPIQTLPARSLDYLTHRTCGKCRERN